ncbi:MAG: hypothetical protein JW715_03015 [Sedimentisphaerales bacterium]|nr:hypothetical protein [Sedimentisphaerales bacterium]
MKKLLIISIIPLCFGLVLLISVPCLKAQEQQPVQTSTTVNTAGTSPDKIVFDMKYCSLSGKKDELRYNSYWGFGGREQETPFIKELKKDKKELTVVYNRYFKDAEWSAVEIKNKKPVAFYFDLNADGKFSENEKILPSNTEETSGSTTTEFVTPDFTIKTEDNQKVPFRALMQIRTYNNNSSTPNCMWSPSCVLEGTSTIDGQSTKLILFTNGFTGSFSDFGRCSYYLDKSEKNIGRYTPTQTLSSIINYNGQFYNLKLNGSHEEGKTIQAVMEKYTGTTGNLRAQLTGNTDLAPKLTGATIIGSKDKNVYFRLSGDQTELPTGTYQLSSGYLNYGKENEDYWQLNFTDGPEFAIETNKTGTVELGKPVLSISAVDETKRYQSDVKEQKVYSKGQRIYLTRKISGMADEIYGRFSKIENKKQTYIKPSIRIIDPDGKQIVSAEMEYG